LPNSLIYVGCPPAERPQAEKLLKSLGIAPRWADDAAGALRSLEQHDTVVLADFANAQTPRVVREIRQRRPATFLVAIADASRPGILEEIEQAGLPVVLHRPLSPRMLSLLFPWAAANQADGPGAAPHRGHAPIVAQSPAMRGTLEAVARAAASRAGVLVCGETGTGRHMVAREIHRRTASSSGQFVFVDCSDASADALQDRLFGTLEDEGPTAAGERRSAERVSTDSALFEARGGTLFLAHVADAPSRLQARLARALRDGEVVVGDARRPTPLDVRPIASSDPSWDAAVGEGRIRADLSRRIAVTRVDVPPLRTRREDIPQLAGCLLHRACAGHRLPVKAIEPSAVALLTALPWRGNARELNELLETLVSRTPGDAIRLEDVLGAVRLDAASMPFMPAGTLRQARQRFERDYITAVLEQHRGRMGEAAHALGIQRTNLYRKMRSLKVSWRGHNGNGSNGNGSNGSTSSNSD
jgi:DNA-binding NtrC family response regulator